MTLCCTSRAGLRWSLYGLWVLLLCGKPLWGQSPAVATPELDSVWSETLPREETRISWGWPSMISDSTWGFGKTDASVSMQPAPESPPRLFGVIDWLGELTQRPTTQAFADPFALPTEEEGLSLSWLDWEPFSRPEQVTLVRGGLPQMFARNGRARIEYGDEFEDVKRIRGQLLWAFRSNIGIDASVNSWQDNRPSPKSLGDFWTGDANLVYSMGAQRVAMRGGVGASWVHDSDFDLGYNFTYGADLFLTRPWLVSGEIDYGRINGDKLFHWRGSFGVQLLWFEVYVGYDSYQWDKIRFDGPVAGAGLWF